MPTSLLTKLSGVGDARHIGTGGTIEAYSRAIRRIGERFGGRIDALTEQQLTDYFTDLVASHSWSTVKLDLYGLKFYYAHVLRKPWVAPGLIKPPKTQRLPDIVTIAEARRLFGPTRVVSYRAFYFALYSLGLRLDEGLRLQVGDIDAARARVHVRDAKGNRDRFVPLPQATHQLPCRVGTARREPQMHMIGHQHIGVNGTRALLGVLTEPLKVRQMIFVGEKTRLAVVPPLNDMHRNAAERDA